MVEDAKATPDGGVLSSRVADTILGAKESWTRRMFELAAQLRGDGGGPVYDLSLGNPSLEPPAIWRKTVQELLDDEPPGLHRYMTNAGYPEVRAFLAEREGARYGLPFETADVLMTVGAAGGLNVTFRAVIEPGDRVLVPAPYFSEYGHYCESAGAQLVPVETDANFAPKPEAFAKAVAGGARIVLLNSPNNPTGAIYPDEVLAELAAILRQHNAKSARPTYVLEDSPYRDLTYDSISVPSMLAHYDNTLFLTSHSKDLGLAGERIGYLLISPRCQGRDLLRRALPFCNRILGFVNAPALMQRALPKVLASDEGRVDVSVYAENCRTMATGLREIGFTMPEPKAGFFLFPKLPDSLLDETGGDIALTDALREHRTIVVPGTAFGVPAHLRLALCVDSSVVGPALDAFRRVCA